jgi:hypothetical protein
MQQIYSFNKLPRVPAVYVLYGGQDHTRHAAYVGIADVLKTRIIQHLVNRDSSVTTGKGAAQLNPDHVTCLHWWEHPDFTDRPKLEAAELIAFTLFDPILRSRGKIRAEAKRLKSDPTFAEPIKTLLKGTPSGQLTILTLDDAFARIVELERRLAVLERYLKQ